MPEIQKTFVRGSQMNKLIFLGFSSPVLMLLVPNVYAGGPDDAKHCYEVGLNNGLDIARYPTGYSAFHYNVFDHCDRPYFNPSGEHDDNPYYKGFIDGCKDAGNTEETCERFTDA